MSSTDVKIFEKEEFGSVRVVMQGDDPWFVAKDVCDCLDLSNNRGAIASLDDDEKGVSITDTLGGQQEMSIIQRAVKPLPSGGGYKAHLNWNFCL